MNTETYSFNSLSKDIQEKVLDRFSDINTFEDCYADCIIENFKDELNIFGFINPDIHFRGFGSQGDGSCFDCGHIDIEKFLIAFKDAKLLKKYRRLISLNKSGYIEFYIYTRTTSKHYCHSNTRYIEFEVFTSNNKPSYYKRVYNLINELVKLIESVRLDFCNEIYKDIEAEYDYQTDKPQIIQYIENNAFEFDVDGNVIR